jgi:putative ABC transport system ATP-binding protein
MIILSFESILQVKNISWSVNNKPIIQNISFELPAGGLVSLMGPSGAGKSSILRLIVRFVEFQSGSVLYQGQDICRMDVINLRHNIGYLLQDAFLLEGTVRDNLVYGPRLRGLSVDDEKMIELLDHVHLTPSILDEMVNHLSGGEKQRVAIVRMLMNSPKILLLDEITSALGLTSTLMVEELIQDLREKLNLSIIMVSHDLDQAERMDGTLIFLVKGQIIEMGPTEDVLHNPQNSLTQAFLKGELK